MPNAPYHSKTTATVAAGATQLVSTSIFGRKLTLTGYPVDPADPAYGAFIYCGYDNTVGPTNFAFVLRTGDIHEDESQDPQRIRLSPHIFWFAVSINGAGLAYGVE